MSYKSETQLLTQAECLEIIKNDLAYKDSSDINLLSYKITKYSADLVGFMGEYYKLEVEAVVEKISQEAKKRTYFIKSLPVDNEIHRNECERKGFFIKESSIYNNILPNIQKYAHKPLFPKAFLARPDILVLEDFSTAAKCLRQLLPTENYTLQHYQLFLQHLASLHAASLAWEFKENINIGQEFASTLCELQLANSNEWYTVGLQGILYLAQQHPKFQYVEALEFINHKLLNILLDMENFAKPSLTHHNVLCHRDAWDRNIFWEFNNSNELVGCRIVDFQLSCYSPPAIDVLYFLYHNFESSQQRSKLLKDLLLFYHKSLKDCLKILNLPEDLITQNEFDEDCQRALLPILTLKAICEPLMKLPKGWSQLVRDTEPETFDRYMNKDRTEMFSRVSKIDSSYMDKILEPVQELLEYFNFTPK